MKFVATFILVLSVVLVFSGCAAKTPKSAPQQEFAAAAAAEGNDNDHSAHAHVDTPLPTQTTPPAEHAPQPAASEETAAFAKAKPIFEKYCAKCHTEASGKRTALKHFVMDAYPFAGHHASSMPMTIRSVLGQSGKRATMPKNRPGVIIGDELKLILEWADAAERAEVPKPQPSGGHDHH